MYTIGSLEGCPFTRVTTRLSNCGAKIDTFVMVNNRGKPGVFVLPENTWYLNLFSSQYQYYHRKSPGVSFLFQGMSP